MPAKKQSQKQLQTVMVGGSSAPEAEVSLLDILDNVLNSGVVIQGSLVLSLAGVDLIYIGVSAVLTSVETALKSLREEGRAS